MGVPRLYRWLSERYPLINTPVTQASCPPVDNLYLDMNGIMHNNARAPGNPHGGRTEDEIFAACCKYIDMLVSLVRPQRVLFMAVDGVAPRAKMNQQRSRRFRSARDREAAVRQAREAGDASLPDDEARLFDSNCITPGTAFMHRLSECLRYYVARKLEQDLAWRKLTVIVSGAEAPGEGEHKIMEYIRSSRQQYGAKYDPNTRHCVYGLDADLVFLGLISHEPHFVLLREKVDFQAAFRKKRRFEVQPAPLDRDICGDFELLSIGVLREYLELEFEGVREQLDARAAASSWASAGSAEAFDLERVVDDFALLAFLVGNDFIPHSPTLDISEGALNSILRLYKGLLPRFGGYITDVGGQIRFERLEIVISKLGLLEAYVLDARRSAAKRSGKGGGGGGSSVVGKAVIDGDHSATWGFSTAGLSSSAASEAQADPNDDNDDDEEEEEEELNENGNDGEGDEEESEVAVWDDEATAHALSAALDASKLGSMLPFKRKYYAEKLGIDYDRDHESMRALRKSYLESIVWTFQYYVNGVCSWRWYYPYHYAPMGSDMVGLSELAPEINMELGTPFLPMQQLMAVLPPQSAWCLPRSYASLMTDDASPLKRFYPSEVKVDKSGKKNEWEGVVLVPFVDEDELLRAMAAAGTSAFSAVERTRNQLGASMVMRSAMQRLDGGGGGGNDEDGGSEAGVATAFASPFAGMRAVPKSSGVRMEPLKLPPHTGFRPQLLDGTVTDGSLINFPSLRSLQVPHSADGGGGGGGGMRLRHEFAHCGVNVFGMASKWESCVLRPELSQTTAGQTAIDVAAELQGQGADGSGPPKPALRRLVDYPWHTPARVVAVEDAKNIVHLDEAHSSTEQMAVKKTNTEGFLRRDKELVSSVHTRWALSVPRGDVHVHVRRVSKTRPDGEVLTWSDEVQPYPRALVRPLNKTVSAIMAAARHHFMRHRGSGVDSAARFPLRPHDRVVFCGLPNTRSCDNDTVGTRRFLFGCVVTVSAVEKNAMTLRVPTRVQNKKPFLAGPLHKERAGKLVSLSGLMIVAGTSEALNMPFASMLTGQVRCRIPKDAAFGDLRELNLGLGWKYSGKALYMPGYADPRFAPGVKFTMAAVDVLRHYYKAFPDLLRRMSAMVAKQKSLRQQQQQQQEGGGGVRSNSSAEFVFDAVELFGNAAWKTEVQRVLAFLRSLECASLPLLRMDSEALSRATILEIQDNLEAASTAPDNSPKTELVCRRRDVTIGGGLFEGMHGADFALFELGDHVVNISSGGAVPLGLPGVVVAVHRRGGAGREVDVVFDEAFLGGSDLQGRCRGNAGKTLVADESLLNVTAHFTKRADRMGGSVGGCSKNRRRPPIAADDNGGDGDGGQKKDNRGRTAPVAAAPKRTVAAAGRETQAGVYSASKKQTQPRSAADASASRSRSEQRVITATAVPFVPQQQAEDVPAHEQPMMQAASAPGDQMSQYLKSVLGVGGDQASSGGAWQREQ